MKRIRPLCLSFIALALIAYVALAASPEPLRGESILQDFSVTNTPTRLWLNYVTAFIPEGDWSGTSTIRIDNGTRSGSRILAQSTTATNVLSWSSEGTPIRWEKGATLQFILGSDGAETNFYEIQTVIEPF